MFKILIIGSLFVLSIFKFTIGQEPCQLPRGGKGSCVSINKCPALINILQKKDKTPQDHTQLRDSLCGAENSPKVCCNNDDETSCSDPSVAESLLNEIPCGILDSTDRIVGGNVTGLTDYNWMILIEYESNRGIETSCGGSLISRQYVLTAAHCVVNLKGRIPKNIRLSEYDTSNKGMDCVKIAGGKVCNEGTVVIPISKIIVHPEYKAGKESINDIALIRMNSPAKITDYVGTICLPKFDISETLDESNKEFDVAGWGYTTKNRQRASKKKLYAYVPYVDNDVCSQSFPAILRDRHVCAGGNGKTDSCGGDSGGPLMYNIDTDPYVLVGIVSYGSSICAIEGIPAVYTKTFAYLDWIKCNMQPE